MVTATIIAHNEGHRIARCLDSIRWVDEILVVVDERTSDDTEEVARRYTPRVHVRPFAGFSDQRQWADEQASGDWIFSIDCDEVVPEALAREIQDELKAPRFQAYRIPHLDYMFGKWIRYGGWYPQFHVRLYRRAAASWQRAVHEKVALDGPLGTLQTPLLHFSHGRLENWVNKMSLYTGIEAQAMQEAGAPVGVARILFEPPLMFGYKYFVLEGWRDGMHGLALALLLGCTRLIRNLKAWDLRQAARGPVESPDLPPRMRRPS
jgi:glycosyltransferase involved in cell wall biosynthesis